MRGVAIGLVSSVASAVLGIVLARTAMAEWLVSTFEASAFNTVISFLVAALFGASLSLLVNEWRLKRSSLGRRLDEERRKSAELKSQLAAAIRGVTPHERDEEVERLRGEVSSLRQANAFYQRRATSERIKGSEARKRARSKFSRLSHEEAAFVYELFKGKPALVTPENATVVASAYRAGAIENLNVQGRAPTPGCFVRVREEWTRLMNEHEDDFREIHGV